jgi:uncharacterized protein
MPKKTKTISRKPPLKPVKRKSTVKAAAVLKKKARAAAADPKISIIPNDLELSSRKFVLTQSPAHLTRPAPAYEDLGDLPDAYGTKKLYLVSRDPHWLFAYWDLNWQQYQDAVRAAHDGKVFLQIYAADGNRLQQIQISESTRNWHLHVHQADAAYYAEIGYYRADGGFEVISRSGAAATPRDSVSWNTQARFVTIPFHLSFQQLFELIKGHLLPGEDLAEALARLQDEGFEFPFATPKGRMLSDESHKALLEYLGGDFIRRMQVGSLEITEILRRRFEEMRSSGQWTSSVSSPFGASFGAGAREFFMHVNAELIIYGGTDPKARVRVDGEDITLRPDGTFSYHFTFPDGKFHIPIEAVSPDGVEMRSALLSFMRMSDYTGDVKKTGQPSLLEPLGRK